MYSLQKKDIKDTEEEKYDTSDLISVRLDFLKLAKYLLENYHANFYNKFKDEIEQFESALRQWSERNTWNRQPLTLIL